ncbi:hypothetical protein IE077_002534 [Cardiosporidium cionae]|uniref:ATPase AAA-type core domain-containing protein n=1 Tax=Cardiosporidium cionae TaxID=476202 RepID=A0ABQ7JFZ7_9APIC|nr:hypothetical protein IE077_002534 [Cardiosporidium cionae]|eukprot:KAF8822810.1 hypothetical protein IE077_002534 [Cardiosporidium cionae]
MISLHDSASFCAFTGQIWRSASDIMGLLPLEVLCSFSGMAVVFLLSHYRNSCMSNTQSEQFSNREAPSVVELMQAEVCSIIKKSDAAYSQSAAGKLDSSMDALEEIILVSLKKVDEDIFQKASYLVKQLSCLYSTIKTMAEILQRNDILIRLEVLSLPKAIHAQIKLTEDACSTQSLSSGKKSSGATPATSKPNFQGHPPATKSIGTNSFQFSPKSLDKESLTRSTKYNRGQDAGILPSWSSKPQEESSSTHLGKNSQWKDSIEVKSKFQLKRWTSSTTINTPAPVKTCLPLERRTQSLEIGKESLAKCDLQTSLSCRNPSQSWNPLVNKIYQIDNLPKNLAYKMRNMKFNGYEILVLVSALVTATAELVPIEGHESIKQKLKVLGNTVLLRKQTSVWESTSTRTMVLVGPPKCGKTTLVEEFANDFHASLFKISSDFFSLVSSGAEKQNLTKAIFSTALKLQPCVIYFSHYDRLGEVSASPELHTEILDFILKEKNRFSLDETSDRVALLFSSHTKCNQNHSLVRKGISLEISYPDFIMRRTLLHDLFVKSGLEVTQNMIEQLVNELDGCSVVDVWIRGLQHVLISPCTSQPSNN